MPAAGEGASVSADPGTQRIPPCSGRAVELDTGDTLVIIDPEGQQVQRHATLREAGDVSHGGSDVGVHREHCRSERDNGSCAMPGARGVRKSKR